MKMEQSVPKRRHIKFRRRGITQKKTYNKIARVLTVCVIPYVISEQVVSEPNDSDLEGPGSASEIGDIFHFETLVIFLEVP